MLKKKLFSTPIPRKSSLNSHIALFKNSLQVFYFLAESSADATSTNGFAITKAENTYFR